MLIKFKKLILYPITIFILLTSLSIPVQASTADLIPKSGEGSTTEEPTISKPLLLPVSVTEPEVDGHNFKYIVKTYALSPSEDPADIDTDDFISENVHYTLKDIIKNERYEESIIEHTEIVEIDSPSDRLEDIMPLLDEEIEFTKGGYTGILKLNVGSVTCEVKGYKTNTYEVSKEREFPGLPSTDTALIPKTIEENGKIYSLADINYDERETNLVDSYTLPSTYTAKARYTATATSSTPTGYVTKAEYNGELYKNDLNKIYYEVIFVSSSPIHTVVEPPEIETPRDISSSNKLLIPIIFLITISAAIICLVLFVILPRIHSVRVFAAEDYGKYINAGRMRFDAKAPEPIINLNLFDNKQSYNLLTCIIELSPLATKCCTGKTVLIKFADNEILHTIEVGHGFKKYQIEVDFTAIEGDSYE